MLGGDNSNTQFALLALWVAQRNKLPMRAPLAFGAEYFGNIQSADGSWGYTFDRTKESCSSMTCAGLLALAIGRSVGRKPDDRAMQRGFQYLVPIFDKAGSSRGNYYYLWSVERACLIYGLKHLRNIDWYEWESEFLVKSQATNGSWQDVYPPFCDTCFALLILKRINIVKDLKIDDGIKDHIKKVVNIKDVNN
jgi:hypothetical protein